MSLFSKSQISQINAAAEKSKKVLAPLKPRKKNTSAAELESISAKVVEYFKDSTSELIQSEDQLADYVDDILKFGYAGIDTETTGLDRQNDTIVGASLYVPGRNDCYIPSNHLIPIFDEPYKGQLTYEQISRQFKRIQDSKTKLIFANADFDLSMIYKDLHVDFCDNFFYDVILAWRCLKEDELKNGLKELYYKYVKKGKGDAMKFNDFFTPKQFPYVKPEVAKLYAANDAKITYELFLWQLPYTLKSEKLCQKNHLESIADLIWGVEFPLVPVCQQMHRAGIYFDDNISSILIDRYQTEYDKEMSKLKDMVQEIIDNNTKPITGKRYITKGADFNPNSEPQVKYLCKDLLGVINEGTGTGKEVLSELNLPVTNQILKVRSLSTLKSSFVDKLPKSKWSDNRIHPTFKQIGASTGRMSSADPNAQNIPSHAEDIRHLFRATPEHTVEVEGKVDDTTKEIVITLEHFASVPTTAGYVRVEDLQPGQIVILQHGDDLEGEIRVKRVESNSQNSCLRDIIF